MVAAFNQYFPHLSIALLAMSSLVLPTYLTCQTQLVMTGGQLDYSINTNLGGCKIRVSYIYQLREAFLLFNLLFRDVGYPIIYPIVTITYRKVKNYPIKNSSNSTM